MRVSSADGSAAHESCHSHVAAEFGEHGKSSHISKMVLSIVKFGGPAKTELRTFRWEVLI